MTIQQTIQKELSRSDISDATKYFYKVLAKHINNTFGVVNMKAIREADIATYVEQRLNTAALSTVIAEVVFLQKLTGLNLCRLIQQLKSRNPKRQPMTLFEAKRLLYVAKRHPYSHLYSAMTMAIREHISLGTILKRLNINCIDEGFATCKRRAEVRPSVRFNDLLQFQESDFA